ncbi:MAG TPA: hypothetical protein VK497_04320 [Candidatus Saccharimonadales bacterium]|nr:hypothetical protein [Candidatus Saccharimonadales bacterium]
MTTPKSNNPEISPSEFLSSKEGTVSGSNETYIDKLVEKSDDKPLSPERRAFGDAVLQATPANHNPYSYELSQIASLHEQSAVETLIPFDQLSEQALSARILQIRKEMLKGTRQDFDLAA